jgi:hypothetical protein
MVLVDSESGLIHALNSVAALVWQCFDGESSLAELVVDLADGFKASPDMVRQDVLTMARSAARSGLLDGVVARESTEPQSIGLAPGEPTSFLSRREDGSGPATRRTLLVNWSTTCGFCVRILPELAILQPALDRAGTDMVLLDGADPVATQRLVDACGLVARVVTGGVRGPDSAALFAGMGTPVAYLLDTEGRVASPLAYGAVDVVRLARLAAGRDTSADGPYGVEDIPRFLPLAGGVCGQGTVPAGTSLRWERPAAYDVGPYRLGIRAASISAERILAAVLAEHRLPDTETAPDNYSVILTGEPSAGRRSVNLLMTGSRILARSRSPRRLIQALVGHLSCLLEARPGVRRLDAVGALIGGEAVLLPKEVASWLERVQAPLARLGFAVVDEPFAHVDPATRELVVGESQIRIDEEILAAVEDSPVGPSEPAQVPKGRYPLRGWLMPAHNGRVGDLSPSGAVAGALGELVGSPEDMAEAIDSFVSLLEGVDTVAVPCAQPEEFIQALRNWCSGAEASKWQ